VLKNENIFRSSLSPREFEDLCLATFQFQYANNRVYQQWLQHLKRDHKQIKQIEDIPFLPIELFKSREIVASAIHAQSIRFTSSTTTSQIPSTHIVNDVRYYEESFRLGFQMFYGDVKDYAILALLPNYLQRGGSSLVYMCDRLIKDSKCEASGFYLDDTRALLENIFQLKQQGKKILLIGVSYALLDLCELSPELGDEVIVMETGGMKGRRKELLKPELHAALKEGLGVSSIHSEYGMTELLSQAYSQGDGLFRSPPWMQFLIRETADPLSLKSEGRTGGINVIDLANQLSCSFIATKDLGRLHDATTLELMGRFNDSDVRGCNLMIENY
jgi:phenylacetate-coenzyme A ligase PaaK-like adenylate-forming protein